MAFAADALANVEAANAFTQGSNLAHVLVADGHTGLHMLGSPIIPIVDMDIGTADRGHVDLNENFTGANFGHGNLSQGNAFTGVGFNKSIHHFLRHGFTLLMFKVFQITL
jgi:hypothetical protein